MPSKRKRNPIENLLGYTNLREKRRKKREDNTNNNTLEEKENVGTYCNSILHHFQNKIKEKYKNRVIFSRIN